MTLEKTSLLYCQECEVLLEPDPSLMGVQDQWWLCEECRDFNEAEFIDLLKLWYPAQFDRDFTGSYS